MFSPVEIKRLFHEWRLRFKRMATIASPPSWDEAEWKSFAQALTLRVRDRGSSWQVEDKMYWDLRWQIAGGGELICQVEHIPGNTTTTIVAQTGGFATGVNSYTWFWVEFDVAGEFSRPPYWVDGTWKDALMSMLMPANKRAAFLLEGPVATPVALLLQDDTGEHDSNRSSLVPTSVPIPRTQPQAEMAEQ
ncbi:MAG: hypothetical protein ACAI35_04865 [Candidatus Methylacidiphilales bacterium]|nr:hypothetical protein [Candidatus Methylacidiphilales bacterium]